MYAGDYPDSKVIEYMNLDVPEITRQIGLKESGQKFGISASLPQIDMALDNAAG